MGDTDTHALIDDKVVAIAKSAMPPPFAEEAPFIRLGNWLTDFSQFQDPTSFMSGKVSTWKRAKEQTMAKIPFALSTFANLDGFLDDLFGSPGQDGKIVPFARKVALAITVNKFSLAEMQIDAGQVEDLFNKYYTQYYPHEHLDFPPWPWGMATGDRTASSVTQHTCDPSASPSKTRSILQYTEEQLVYVADRLTAVQQKWKDWASTGSEGSDRQPLREILCEYGHCSHAVEDFFFHSNFLETTWQILNGDKLPDSTQETWQKRRYYRRLRAPLGTNGDADLDTSNSNATSQVFTGYFGAKDIFHSFADGFLGLMGKVKVDPALLHAMMPFASVQDEHDPTQSHSDLQDDTKRRKMLDDFRVKYRDGSWARDLDAFVAAKKLHPRSAELFKSAFADDDDLAKMHQGMEIKDWGIVGFVLEILAASETEQDDSQARSKALDDQNVIQDNATDNQASGENIGSHSLMAKDSVREEPLRPQAVNAASMVAKYLIWTMLHAIYPNLQLTGARANPDGNDAAHNTADQPRGIDWLHLIRHFVCHPSEAEGSWCDLVLDNEDAINFHCVWTITDDEVQKRCKEEKRAELEKKYKDGEDFFQQLWKKTVSKSNLVDAMIVGAVAGAIAGAIIGYAAGGALGAVIGAVAGAVVGGALGAMIGALAG